MYNLLSFVKYQIFKSIKMHMHDDGLVYKYSSELWKVIEQKKS